MASALFGKTRSGPETDPTETRPSADYRPPSSKTVFEISFRDVGTIHPGKISCAAVTPKHFWASAPKKLEK